MQQIFERETRREKNLDIQRKLNTDPKPVKKEKNPEKVQQEKEQAQKEKLKTIEEKFFEHVADEQFDVATIKARGDVSKHNDDVGNVVKGSSAKIELVEL